MIKLTFGRAILSLEQVNWSAWIATLLLTSIIWAQPLSGGPRVPSVILMLIGVFLIIKGRFSLKDLRWQRFLLILALFWLPALISLPGSFAPEKTIQLLVLLPLYLLFAATAFYLLDSYVKMRMVMFVFFLVSIAGIGDGLFQLAYGHDIFGLSSRYGSRITGPFHHLRLSLFIAILLPVIFSYLQRYGWLWQLLYFFAALTIAMLSGVRTDMLTVLLATGLYLVGHKKGILILAIIPLVIAAGLFAGSYSSIAKSKLSTFSSWPTTYAQWNKLSSYRLDIWSTAWNMLRANPINGVGAKSFAYGYNEYKNDGNIFDEDGNRASHAHHPIISIAAETGGIGLVGFLLTCLLVYCWGRESGSRRLLANPWLQILILIVFPIQSMPILFTLWWFPVVALVLIMYLNDIEPIANNRLANPEIQ